MLGRWSLVIGLGSLTARATKAESAGTKTRDQRQKPPLDFAQWGFRMKGWRRPTLPPPRSGSTIGAAGLNCRVRNGNGCGPCALVVSRKVAGYESRATGQRDPRPATRSPLRNGCVQVRRRRDQTSRAISSARLKGLLPVHLRPINLVVSQGPSGTLWSRSVHLGKSFPLRCFQRLSPRDIATGRCPWRNSPYTSGRFVSVLSY